MDDISGGRTSRKSRILGETPGVWGSSSQDFALLSSMLYHRSAMYAKKYEGNYSIYAIAGIPMLLSALRCLLIELNAGMYTPRSRRQEVLVQLSGTSRDIDVVINNYSVPEHLKSELKLLWEVRNEIVHPAHGPGTGEGMTPRYLRGLRDRGLLNSTGKEPDYIWIEQLKSHKLFRWAFSTIRETITVLLARHELKETDPMGPTLRATYSRFEQIDREVNIA